MDSDEEDNDEGEEEEEEAELVPPKKTSLAGRETKDRKKNAEQSPFNGAATATLGLILIFKKQIEFGTKYDYWFNSNIFILPKVSPKILCYFRKYP